MRILHIVGSINPAAGGPSEFIRMMIEYSPQGYDSEVATLDSPDSVFLADLPFQVHALGAKRSAWYSARLLPWLKANRDRFDGVIVHGLWEFTGLAALLAFGGRKPYIVFAHGMLDPYFKQRYPLKHAKKWIYWMFAQYWVLRYAARVMFTTTLERDLAQKSFWLWRWNASVVSCGADPELPNLTELKATFHPIYPEMRSLNGPVSLLLFMGRIDPKKGCDLLLHAFAAVAPAHPELHLVMAGPDPQGLRTDLQVITDAVGVGERVHWPGMLRGDAKWGAFAACEAFILPSHQENFGIAVAEALACGRPVLISDQVNIAHEIASDGCGLVEPDTIAGTTRLLQRWLALSEEQREAMRGQARLTFETRYDMRRNSANILRIFEHLQPPAVTEVS